MKKKQKIVPSLSIWGITEAMIVGGETSFIDSSGRKVTGIVNGVEIIAGNRHLWAVKIQDGTEHFVRN